jgi:hypothetical protein
MAPPVVLEIKHGKKSDKGYPTKLEGMIVVTRERSGSGDKANFSEAKDVMDALSVDPVEGLLIKKIPIRLISDDPAESFHMFRGLYVRGKLACGSNYGETTAMRRFRASEWTEPYEFACKPDCPKWNQEKEPCDLGGTLYCNLGEGMPRSGDLVLYRLNGRHAQRRMLASLKILEERCGKVMAGIPLQIAFYSELVKDGTNKMRSVPIVVVEPDDRFNLDDSILVELERRRKIIDVKRAIMGEVEGAALTLRKAGMLRDIQRREIASNIEETDDHELNLALDHEDNIAEGAVVVAEFMERYPNTREGLIRMAIRGSTRGDGTVNEEEVAAYLERATAKKERA